MKKGDSGLCHYLDMEIKQVNPTSQIPRLGNVVDDKATC